MTRRHKPTTKDTPPAADPVGDDEAKGRSSTTLEHPQPEAEDAAEQHVGHGPAPSATNSAQNAVPPVAEGDPEPESQPGTDEKSVAPGANIGPDRGPNHSSPSRPEPAGPRPGDGHDLPTVDEHKEPSVAPASTEDGKEAATGNPQQAAAEQPPPAPDPSLPEGTDEVAVNDLPDGGPAAWCEAKGRVHLGSTIDPARGVAVITHGPV